MKFYLDQTFPSETVNQIPLAHTCIRWTEGPVEDTDFIALAAKRNFDLLIFLGRKASSRPEVWEAVRIANVTLLLTNETNPQTARTHLVTHLPTIEANLAPGKILILFAGRVELAR